MHHSSTPNEEDIFIPQGRGQVQVLHIFKKYAFFLVNQSHNVHNRSLGEITSRIYVTYNNYVNS